MVYIKTVTVHKNRNQISSDYKVKKLDTIFKLEYTYKPPLMFDPKTWSKYGYSRDDIDKTIKDMERFYIWQIVLVYNPNYFRDDNSMKGIESIVQSPFCFSFKSKSTLCDQLRSLVEYGSNNVLHKDTIHKPNLPYIESDKYNEMDEHIPVRLPSFCWEPMYKTCFKIKDEKFVPFEKQGDYIYMVRCIEKDEYEKIPVRPKRCILTLPVSIKIKNRNYIALDEGFIMRKRRRLL